MFMLVYRLALQAYPKSFRDEYEQEMLATFDNLLESAPGLNERLWLCLRLVAEVIQWAPRERLEAVDAVISATPGVVLWGSVTSISLLAPFLLAVFYRLH